MVLQNSAKTLKLRRYRDFNIEEGYGVEFLPTYKQVPRKNGGTEEVITEIEPVIVPIFEDTVTDINGDPCVLVDEVWYRVYDFANGMVESLFLADTHDLR